MEVSIDFGKKVGKIKPMHAVGQGPLYNVDFQYFHYLKDAHIPYARLHDVGGMFGGNLWVDIPNIFRDFDADEYAEDSYDFSFTDLYLKALVDNGCEPYFRLGVTIENYHNIKAYRIFPPKDFNKWAVICEHIVRHYNEGWANGFHYNIKYWEIWNEPDTREDISSNNMWKGTKEEYFELYAITAKHLRKCFGNTIKIGGYASTGLYSLGLSEEYLTEARKTNPDWVDGFYYHLKFFNEFTDMVKKENLPLDFFSHHSYLTVEQTIKMEKAIEEMLLEKGFNDIEIHLNEWNVKPGINRERSSCASQSLAMMCGMQNTKTDIMCYYDARMKNSYYAGLFNEFTLSPFCNYYGFKAFGELYVMGNQVEVNGLCNGVYATGAISDTGDNFGFVITNIEDDKEIETNLPSDMFAYLIDENHFLTKTEINNRKFKLNKDESIYFCKKELAQE